MISPEQKDERPNFDSSGICNNDGGPDRGGDARSNHSFLISLCDIFSTPSEREKLRKVVEVVCESTASITVMSLLTFWTLYQGDILLAATKKDADFAFEIIVSICFFLFTVEILFQCFYKDGYIRYPTFREEDSWLEKIKTALSVGSFYFWMDLLATFTLVFDMTWMLNGAFDSFLSNGGDQSASAGGNGARIGTRVGRILRVARIVRFTRIGKLYRYATSCFYLLQHHIFFQLFRKEKKKVLQDEERLKLDNVEESKVGSLMADLTNQRVITLIILMLIIIPLLAQNDPDASLQIAVRLVQRLAALNATNPETYENGLLLALNITLTQLPVLSIVFNDTDYIYANYERLAALRDAEKVAYYQTSNATSVEITYDIKESVVTAAQYSMYTTTVVLVLLILGIYAFSADVQALVILPIEKLVALVKKIAENPLGVEYKMLGEEDGFQDGMETTVLLTTINKIGGLMKVGFGKAGAGIIARNLSDAAGGKGKLNLLGKGTMIYSIFGFCDVRQFTDTTECLQEEVMLFVNRIAHILHSIVVQCSGAANKNIGDAFLLTWKIDEKATKEQKALLADQALLTFCKALIELARHQEFICNFSVAATGRLFKRFPDYKVRIGSGLHVGWAIEGAIGSNRKIDASYISPHVSTTEFLESSTKEYGVSLLMSEPFYRLLSPAAARFVRQVDRIRRSEEEGPMGLYTYDCDLSIDWNDPFRHRKKSTAASLSGGGGGAMDARTRFQNAVRRTSQLLTNPLGLQAALGLAPIQEVKSVSTNSRLDRNGGGEGSDSQSRADSHSNSRTGSHHSVYSSHPSHPLAAKATLGIRRKGRTSILSHLGGGGGGNGGVSGGGGLPSRQAEPRASVYSGRRPSIMLRPMNLQSYASIPLNEADEENPEVAETEAAEKLRRAKMTPTIIVPAYSQNIWVEDQDLMDLRHLISDQFRATWAEGMDAFIIGDWSRARERFGETLRMSGKKDGPSKHMIKYIDANGGNSPDTWAGFRSLTD